MNVIHSLIATGTIALVSFTSLPIALSETVNPAPVTVESSRSIAELPASFQPGLNRIIFQSEGERMVGNLYLPTSYQPGDNLPVIVVTGAWTKCKTLSDLKGQFWEFPTTRLTEQQREGQWR